MPDDYFLPPGYRLENYQIADGADHVLGSGGFGITYYATDISLSREVAIKEYMPREFAVRDGVVVRPMAGMKDGVSCEKVFHNGLHKFREEGKKLAIFKHRHINEVLHILEANGTEYLVLEYIQGETLASVLERDGRLESARLRRLLDDILSGLEEAHMQRIYHRDLKPGNIMLRAGSDSDVAESAVLIDFGAARDDLGNRQHSSFPAMTPGYAALEQQDPKLAGNWDIGPWTDLYAFGMVAYLCITGFGEGNLTQAISRFARMASGGRDEDLPPAVEVGKGRYEDALLKAVDWAMQVNPQARPQSVAEVRAALAGDAVVPQAPPPQAPSPQAKAQPGVTQKPRRGALWSALGVVVLLAAGGGWWALQKPACHDQTALRSYLADNPGGFHVGHARGCLAFLKQEQEEEEDDAAWVVAQNTNTDAGYDEYLAAYPAGLHTEKAQQRKAEALAEAERKAEALAEAERKAEAERRSFAKEINLGRDFSPDAVDENGWTDLHYAAALNKPELITWLLDEGADIEARLKGDGGPVITEATRKRTEATRKRAKLLESWTRDGETPLHLASSEEAIRLLLERGAKVNAKRNNGKTPLHNAAWNDHHARAKVLIAKVLIEWKANVNAKDNLGETPLHDATRNDHHATAKLLIDNGADVNAENNYGETPLGWAAVVDNHATAKLLIDNGADVNAENNGGGTPLHIAADGDSHATAKLLIDNGADVNAENNYGVTPLNQALGISHAIAKLLIDNGAKVNAEDNYGETPLGWAAVVDNHATAKLLIDNGAKVNAEDNNGGTPLHSAAHADNHATAKLLIDNGAKVNAENNNGGTPLHSAAHADSHATAKLLIDNGADVNAKTNDGETPLDNAKRKNSTKTAALLRQHGAR